MPDEPDWNKLLDTYGLLEILERCNIDEEEALVYLYNMGCDFTNLKEPVDGETYD